MMDVAAEERLKWIPFGTLMVAMIVVTGFWKIEKSLEEPIRPVSEVQPSGQPQKKLEGLPAPDFVLPTLGGGRMRLSDYRGKIVFLNIWATWCPPCREEMPSMQKLHERFMGEDFAMLTISIDEDTSLVGPFMEELGLTFPVALDPEQEVSSQYGITGVPETFLIDKNGIVMHHLIGPGKWDDPSLVSAFEGLVRKPAAPVVEKYQPEQEG